jgi:hypothetical protein
VDILARNGDKRDSESPHPALYASVLRLST